MSAVELVLAPVFAVFYNLHPLGEAWKLLVILPLGTWCLVVNGTFFAALSLRTRHRETLLPLRARESGTRADGGADGVSGSLVADRPGCILCVLPLAARRPWRLTSAGGRRALLLACARLCGASSTPADTRAQ